MNIVNFFVQFENEMREYGGDIHFICLGSHILAKDDFSFKVFLLRNYAINNVYEQQHLS